MSIRKTKENNDSEFRAYVFIENSLRVIGWNVKNPNRYEDGEVYTQGECLNNSIIKEHLQTLKPENIVAVKTNIFWVIEAKPQHKQLEQAIKECKDYCKLLNKTKILAPLFSAVVGNDNNSYIVKNYYYYNGDWTEIEINGKKTTGFLDRQLAREIIDKNNPYIKDHEIADEVYYQKAININEILHNGSINKNNRARVVATMLLALLKDSYINRENTCFSMIKEFNSRAEEILFEKDKREFIDCIKISVPPTPDNHIKFRKALLETMQELDSINIRSAMNSGTGILGRFYEQFLKYGNGSKEIGIVLTPRHITKFAVDVLNITSKDKVLDPACGTGGFLVSAFDKVKNEVDEDELEKFKIEGIYGIEQDPEVVALALVNMIFRGDGRTNLEEGNCFTTNKFKNLKVSKVLMNPPFALKKGDEKEFKFIDFALDKMEKGGYLFAIIPSPVMFRSKNFRDWRVAMLENNTLKAVIKLPDDLFYPVSVCSSAIIIQKGIAHKKDCNVLWGNLKDGYMKKKGVMINSNQNSNINDIKNVIISHLANISKNSEARNFIQKPILFDKYIECTPEGYLDDYEFQDSEIEIQAKIVLQNLISFNLCKQ
jgi:type I restriction enzyme M protein